MKRQFHSIRWFIRRHFEAVRTQIHYYTYDPSKPSKAEFLSLSVEDQAVWIEANVPDHESKLYGDNYLGSSYLLRTEDLTAYLEDREAYGVSALIEEQLPHISVERMNEIDEGFVLSDEELEALQTSIAANDFDGWDTHSGFYFKVRFGFVYALFQGQDIGQGGTSFELEASYPHKNTAIKYLMDKPMVALEC